MKFHIRFAALFLSGIIPIGLNSCSKIENMSSSLQEQSSTILTNSSAQVSSNILQDSFSPEELEKAALQAEKIVDCFVQWAMTSEMLTVSHQIPDMAIWYFVLATYRYREDTDFPYYDLSEMSADERYAYFPIDSVQNMVEQVFGISNWLPDFVKENCDEAVTQIEMPLEAGNFTAYGYENMETTIESDDTIVVSIQLTDTPLFPGEKKYGIFEFVFSLHRTKTAVFTQLKQIDSSFIDDENVSLRIYENLSDIPYHEIRYEEGRGQLTLDGKAWVGAPSSQTFGDLAISDNDNLYIQVFFPNREFRWFCFDYAQEERKSYVLPPISDNQVFTAIQENMLLLPDKSGFDTQLRRWIVDGAVIEGSEADILII